MKDFIAQLSFFSTHALGANSFSYICCTGEGTADQGIRSLQSPVRPAGLSTATTAGSQASTTAGSQASTTAGSQAATTAGYQAATTGSKAATAGFSLYTTRSPTATARSSSSRSAHPGFGASAVQPATTATAATTAGL